MHSNYESPWREGGRVALLINREDRPPGWFAMTLTQCGNMARALHTFLIGVQKRARGETAKTIFLLRMRRGPIQRRPELRV